MANAKKKAAKKKSKSANSKSAKKTPAAKQIKKSKSAMEESLVSAASDALGVIKAGPSADSDFEDMTIYRAEANNARMEQIVAKGQDVQLDLSGVVEMDTTGVQLLAALEKELDTKGLKLEITALSEIVKEVMAFYGASEKFKQAG